MLYNNNEVNIISSTISKNDINGPGGGVYSRKGSNKINIYNSIVSGNVQKGDSKDIDIYEGNESAANLISSINGPKVINNNGEEVPKISFEADDMLDSSFHLVGQDNPALNYGMDAKNLKSLINEITLKLDEE